MLPWCREGSKAGNTGAKILVQSVRQRCKRGKRFANLVRKGRMSLPNPTRIRPNVSKSEKTSGCSPN